MALSAESALVMAAAVGAVPATIGMIASIKTRKSVRTPNGSTLGENSESAMQDSKDTLALLQEHIDDPNAHHEHRVVGKPR